MARISNALNMMPINDHSPFRSIEQTKFSWTEEILDLTEINQINFRDSVLNTNFALLAPSGHARMLNDF